MYGKRKTYSEILNRKEDFKVHYRFYTKEEGGRTSMPHQGIKFNFYYEHDNHTMDGIFSILPEFEDEKGELISSGEVLKEGIARMFIVHDEIRSYHRERINIGTIGYFIEGGRSAECEVIELIGLNEFLD